MATAAHSGSHLEVPGPDDMELHSDHGYDFGDGDIELDLDPVHHDDEDMSIKDAASTTGLDVQTVPTDQDDFMVDDDFITHDYNFTEGEGVHGAAQASRNDADMVQSPKPSDHDDDLIDYSDDEADALEAPADQGVTVKDDHLDAVSDHAEQNEHAASTVHEESANNSIDHTSEHHVEGGLTSNNNHNVDDSYEEYHERAEDRAEEANEQEPESHESEHDEYETNTEEHAAKGGLGLATSVAAKASYDREGDGDHDGTQEHDNEDEQEYGEEQHEENQSDLQPVTVNYAGNELWLFKHHDTDDSGDWLLDDVSLANATMSDLFNGCRLSLGDDVSREHEIGFRFDNLYNMELYEDNTVCVAVTLGRVVELYHKLHSQDGVPEPESFYVTLLFRPRFITLLADVAKYAEQGSGYSGLEAAVAAGETHFSNLDSNTSTDHEVTDWENDEQEEGGVDDEHTDDDDSPAKVEETTHEEYEEHEEVQEQVGESGEVHVEEDYGQYGLEQEGEDEGFLHHQGPIDIADDAEYSVTQQESVGPSDAQASPVKTEEEVRREQAEDDLIEYSDGEDDAVDDERKPTAINDPSPSSSTVQGDELAGASADTAAAQSSNNEDELNFAAEVENVAGFNEQLATGLEDEITEAYPEYDENFGQDDTFPEYQADGTTNQEYADIDQQLQLDFLNDTEVNNTTEDGGVEGLEATNNDITGADDFLDMNDTVWDTENPLVNIQQDEFTFQTDEEDGAGEHSTTAVPRVADAVADSSNHDSPQGLKRSVDEAGHDSEDALDSSDAKRPRV